MGKKDSIHSTALQNTKPNSDNDAYPMKNRREKRCCGRQKRKRSHTICKLSEEPCQSALAWKDRDNNNPRGQQVTENASKDI